MSIKKFSCRSLIQDKECILECWENKPDESASDHLFFPLDQFKAEFPSPDSNGSFRGPLWSEYEKLTIQEAAHLLVGLYPPNHFDSFRPHTIRMNTVINAQEKAQNRDLEKEMALFWLQGMFKQFGGNDVIDRLSRKYPNGKLPKLLTILKWARNVPSLRKSIGKRSALKKFMDENLRDVQYEFECKFKDLYSLHPDYSTGRIVQLMIDQEHRSTYKNESTRDPYSKEYLIKMARKIHPIPAGQRPTGRPKKSATLRKSDNISE